jgi:mannose-6-phosphate isomerase-like protein (cupin superfamily)
MNIATLIHDLNVRYPGKNIITLPVGSDTVGEIIIETDPAINHPEHSTAIAIIDKSQAHVHRNATEEYQVMRGELTVYLNNVAHNLQTGDTITIPPGVTHYAEGSETWLITRSWPGWTADDHFLVNE